MRQSQPATPAARISLGVVPVNKGGTGSTTVFGAVLNLGGIYIPNLDLALSCAKLMSDGKINPLHLPEMFQRGPTLNGLTALYQNQLTTYKITNYDSNTVYSGSISLGQFVNILGDTVTIRAPLVSGPVVLTINGRSATIQVNDPWPLKPTIVASTTGTVSSATGIATGSAFAMIAGNATHRQTDWQLATDANFTNIIQTTLDDSVNLTSWNSKNLAFSTTYYVRARYRANNGVYSEWSDGTQFTTQANYTPDTEEAKLVASDKAANDDFGWTVAMDSTGTRVAISAYRDDDVLASNLGSVYVFRRSGTTWTQEAKLVQYSTLTSNVYTGFSIDMDADGVRVIAGATGTRTSKGSVYVFARNTTNNTWTLEYELYPSNGANNDLMGYSVACDATCSWIAAGAPQRKNGASTNVGGVCLFQRVGTSWNHIVWLGASDWAAGDKYGWSVAFDGEARRLIVGSHLSDPNSVSAAGSAYIYLRFGTTWTLEQKIIASDKAASDQFGYSVAMNYEGSRVAVGANQAAVMSLTQAGAVYIFERAGYVWTQKSKLSAFDRAAGDNFGCAVDINMTGDKLLVGAYLADPSGLSTAGAAYSFTLTESGLWVQDAKLTASDKGSGDNFGVSVAISGEGGRGIVGAWQEDPGGTNNAGSAYIYS